jgi:formamidopyrimidine-DNA glycosylase
MIVRDRRLRWPIAADFEAAVRNQKVLRVDRRAKYLLIRLETGTVILHLGMSGSLRLIRGSTPPKAHDHWDLVLDSGIALRFHDPRRFGSLHFTQDDPAKHALLKKLAPEPLSQEFNGEYLFKAMRRRAVAIKQLIMNSQIVVGVGNIYASEALFRARISPRRAAGRITRAEAEKLAKAIKAVLTAAIKIGGTTLRDYVNADGAPGYFRQKLFVYERAKLACRVCRSPVKQFTQGQRSTYWCSTCQR